MSCANATDVLYLALMLERVGPGDAVFVPTFTFVATAEAAVLLGATPVFVDVLPDSCNMDPKSLEAAIGEAKRQGLRPPRGDRSRSVRPARRLRPPGSPGKL